MNDAELALAAAKAALREAERVLQRAENVAELLASAHGDERSPQRSYTALACDVTLAVKDFGDTLASRLEVWSRESPAMHGASAAGHLRRQLSILADHVEAAEAARRKATP